MGSKEKPQRSIFLFLFGAVFAAVGGLALVLIGADFFATSGTYFWRSVPAENIEIDIEYPEKAPRGHEDDVFRLTANYTYQVDGRKFTGTNFRRKEFKSDSYHKLAERKHRLILDEVETAFVDPDDPQNAILDRESLWSGLGLLFPLPFLLVGLGTMAAGAGLFSSRDDKRKKTTSFAKRRTNDKWGGCGMAIFGSIFFAFGLGFMFPILINPLLRTRSSSDWKEVPCEVIWSRVQRHSGDDSDTFSIDVFYEYDVNGETHRSNRYSFVTGSSSGTKSKQKVVKKYHAGHQATCFVDPVEPWNAVLNRGLGQVGFWWLLPTIFLVVGGFIAATGLRGGRLSSKSQNKRLRMKSGKSLAANRKGEKPKLVVSSTVVPTPSEKASEPLIFHSHGTRFLTLIGTVCVALFWNGIAAILFGQNWLNVCRAGDVDWFLLLFSIPFLLIGAFIVFGVFYSLGGLFNPQLTLHVEPGQPRTGDEFTVSWELSGGLTKLSQLRIAIEGLEETTYRRGTNTVTDDRTFYRLVLADETDPESISSGSVIFELPLGVMPTLDLIDNNIVWRLFAEGRVRWWPDIFDVYELEIFPFATQQSKEVKV